jgi:hypothetical protein
LKLGLPKFQCSKLEVLNLELPKLPKLEVPKLEFPKLHVLNIELPKPSKVVVSFVKHY